MGPRVVWLAPHVTLKGVGCLTGAPYHCTRDASVLSRDPKLRRIFYANTDRFSSPATKWAAQELTRWPQRQHHWRRRVRVAAGEGFLGLWLVLARIAKGYTPSSPQSSTAPTPPTAAANPRPASPVRSMPEVQRTLNVPEAARAAGGRRVVVTSSISAMMPNPRWPRDDPGRPVDKECWTDLDYCKVHKTMAEKAACKYAEKHKLDMVTIDPSTSVGLLLQPGQNAGPAILQQLLQVLLKKLKPGPVACKMWQRSCLGLAFTPLEEAIKTLKRA